MSAWWPHISDTPFTIHRLRATTIRDPLIRYIHRPCILARCFALNYASFYHCQERGTLWGGAFVTHLAHSRGMFHLFQDLPAIQPRKLNRRTLLNIKLASDIPGLGLRFIGSEGRVWQPAQSAVVQQPPPEDHAE
ncbi:hypothetical protein R6Q57_018678 [Mikania cordata]